MKSATFEAKSLSIQNSHVGHSNLIHGSTQLNMSDSNDPNVDIFMHLTEVIRLEKWEV